MSLALIEESAKEVRRLAIAGSPLAVGDFRVKKLIPPLEQAGAKVPVFAQVAKAMSDLVNGPEAESASRLLGLSTLLNAILYTQGKTAAEGEMAPLECLATNCLTTRTTARALKPLIAALTNAGGGRLELIKAACERSAFNDLRLIDPAIRALGDSFPEIADLVAEKILPAYGPGIIPLLKADFAVKGKKQDARKLALMHRLDSAGTLELCQAALEDGSPEVKSAAVACLAQHEECLPLVMEQANSKNKLVRAAALDALAEHDRPEIAKLFMELLKGKALDLLVRPFRVMRSREVFGALLVEGKRVFEVLTKGDEEQFARFLGILDCVERRKDQEVEEFLLKCLAQCDKLRKLGGNAKSPLTVVFSGADVMERLVSLLYDFGSPAAFEGILSKQEVLPPGSFSQVLQSALNIWPAPKVYEEFSLLLQQTKGAGNEKRGILQQVIRATCGGYVLDRNETDPDESLEPPPPRPVEWDPRWLDAAIKANQLVVVCCLAKPGDKAAIQYLLKAALGKPQSENGLMVRALARCQYPKVSDVFLDLVKRRAKSARYLEYDFQLFLRSARYLPRADLPKLDAFAAGLDEKFMDSYLEALAPLRPPASSQNLDPAQPAA